MLLCLDEKSDHKAAYKQVVGVHVVGVIHYPSQFAASMRPR